MIRIVVEIQINNFEELARRLPGLVEKVVHETTEAVADNTQARAPVGATGALRSSVQTAYENNGLTGWVGYGDKEAWYAHFQEFGTNKMSAHPALVPAAEQERRPYVAKLTAVLKKL